MEALYAQLPGTKVVAPSNAYDAKGLMVAAIRDADPVIYLDYGEVKSGDQPDVPEKRTKSRSARRRSASRVRSHPGGMGAGDGGREEGAADLAKAGISVEFIDPRSLKPLDVETLVASAKKTRRLLVVEHGHYTAGFGSHVIAEVVQEVPGIKVRKLAFPDVPGPGSAVMMSWLRPDAPKIVDAAIQMMKA